MGSLSHAKHLINLMLLEKGDAEVNSKEVEDAKKQSCISIAP